MKIALITGPVPYCISIANALSAYCQVDFIYSERTAPQNDSLILSALSKNVNIIQYQEYRRRDPRSLFSYYKLASLLHKNKYDLIHLQYCGTLPMALFWYKVKNIPFVLTVHDPNQHPGLSKLLNLYHDFLQKFFSKKAQRIIVHGPSMHAQYLKKYPKINPACVVDLPHGDLSVCLNFHQQSFSREKKGDYTILFFGTIRPDKGVEYLIKAEPYIAQEIDNFIIKILGNDDFSIADTFIKDPCRFEVNNSYIPHSDVPRYFHEADVVVLPYISATQSGIIPLAYAAGKPVIATRTGGLPDVVLDGKTGFLVEPRDEKTLATAIVAILKDDKLRKEMGENALAFCKENLSWSQIGIKTYNLYRQITNNLN